MIRLISQVRVKNQNRQTICGCTVGQLRRHLELQFKPGMTWDNYGEYWQIDHITPVDFFGPDDDEARNHFSNLQPLTISENGKKRNKIGGIRVTEDLRYRKLMEPHWEEARKKDASILAYKEKYGGYPGKTVFALGEWADA